jgi:hypothetical protein
MINSESFLQQNKSLNVNIGDVQIRREGNYYQVIANGQLIMDYIEFFFQINDQQFHVYDVNSRHWAGFRKIDDSFEKIYESKYLILHYPDLVIEYVDKMLFIYTGWFDHNNSLTANSLVFVSDNFKISKGTLIATNMKQLRMMRYDFKKRTHTSEIIRNGKNKREFAKTNAYFDNIGGIEITDKKGKLWLCSSKFYKLTEKFYCVKDSYSYYVIDIDQKKTIFTGSVIHYQDSIAHITNIATDEVMIVNQQSKTIRVYSWSKYRNGETKEYLKFYVWG